MAGSNKAPGNWKMQYSLDGNSFTDIPNTDFTIKAENRKLMTKYVDLKLPEACNGAETVTLRAVPTSKTTVAGGNYMDATTSGEIAINNIKIMGDSSKEVLAGDANLDGVVNIQDATMIQKYCTRIVKFNSLQLKASDIDKDGKVCIKDVTKIQKNLAMI